MRTFILTGAGRAGTLISDALVHSGWRCMGVIERDDKACMDFCHRYPEVESLSFDRKLPECAMILFAVNDDSLASLCAALDGRNLNTSHLVHFSGYQSSAVFAQISDLNEDMAFHSLHPLLSIPQSYADRTILRDVYIAIEGEDEAWMRQLTGDLGARAFRLAAEEKKYYHIAAVMTANLSLGLLKAAASVAAQAGFSEKDYLEKFMPLIRSVLANLGDRSIDESLSGPLQRGDRKLISAQVEALDKLEDKELLKIYKILADHIVRDREMA